MISRRLVLGLTGLLLVLFCTSGFAQMLSSNRLILLDWVSTHKMSENSARFSATKKATGLTNVGLGETVYLVANTKGTSYAWTITGPTGSTAAINDPASDSTYFQPDVVGLYTVSLTIGGTSTDQIIINAARYIGVGMVDGLVNPDSYCGTACHSAIYAKWNGTKHATAFQTKIDDAAGHYRASCNECHTAGYNTLASADNGGFDDVATDLGWTFPATLQAGNWDSLKANYPLLAVKANIQCESCHGPASGHVTDFDTEKIAKTLEPGACSYCHDAPTHHVYFPEWQKSNHGAPSRANRAGSSCAGCHTGAGFVAQLSGETVNGPYGEADNITCASCHDPHDATNAKQLRTLEDVSLIDGSVISEGGLGKLCMNCHHQRRSGNDATYTTWRNYSSHYGGHYGAQGDMLAGKNGAEFGLTIPSSNHISTIEDACVTCHMAAQPNKATDQVADMGEHTWKMSYMDGTTKVENVTPCQSCHGSHITAFEEIPASHDYDGDGTKEGAAHEIEGLLHNLGMLLPPVGVDSVVRGVSSNRTRDSLFYADNPVAMKALFNYIMIEEDRSMGAHNTAYAAGLLQASIQALNGFIGMSNIVSITDVPNDQGKQVRIMWNMFPGDGASGAAVTSYGIWRLADDMSTGKMATRVETLEDMFKAAGSAVAGSQFVVSSTSEIWDFVKEVPCAGESQYSAVVPTLFDSTRTDGMRLSWFYISGPAENGNMVKSVRASGYSIDNLVPEAPLPKSASKSGGKITIAWSEPVDEDFQYFNVYRGTQEGFNPRVTQNVFQIAETEFTENVSTTGDKYYYVITTVDFSGNESAYSMEISEDNIITGISDQIGTPTEFGLAQNYPNPFNPTTTLRYSLPKSASVSLRIYDILGREIRSLVSGYVGAGYHEIMWDGRDNSGNQVSSGVYIYRIEAGSFSQTRKMILMK